MQSLRLYRPGPQTIRVATSATILGLTLSFAIGEASDHLGKGLGRWEPIPRILPAAYAPLTPSTKLVEENTLSLWRERWVAMNSYVGPAPGEFIAANLPQDEIRFVYSGPQETSVKRAASPVTASPLPLQLASLPPAPLLGGEAGGYLGSGAGVAITAQVQAPPASGTIIVSDPQNPSRRPVILASNAVQEKAAVGAAPIETTDQIIEGEKTIPSVATVSRTAIEKEWAIQGRIFSKVRREGHYEVGLFGKIDPEGNPVGFPLVQEILPAGQVNFRLRLPQRLKGGYLFAEFVNTQGRREWIAPPVNPWQQGSREFVEMVHLAPSGASDVVATVSAAAKREALTVVEGQVRTAFTRPASPILQEGVIVKVRGRKESARTDKDGRFRLELPRATGRLPLEFLKAGFHPSVVEVDASSPVLLLVDLAARTAIDQVVFPIGLRQLSDRSVFMGQLPPSERGSSVQITAKAEGPFYFTDDGRISPDQRSASADGRFIYFNVEPGHFFVETLSVRGEASAPFLVSSVEGGEFIHRRLEFEAGAIRGRIFNPVAAGKGLAPIVGARLRIEGGTEWTSSDGFGSFQFGPIRWVRGERVAIELSATQFQVHRYLVDPSKKTKGTNDKALSLFAFPASYLQRLALSVDVEPDSGAGIIMGNVGPKAVRIDALADHSSVNSTKDFYFSGRGQLLGSHTTTDPKFGTFALFNVPKGRMILGGNDLNGRLRFSDWTLSTPGAVTVVND
jgi:hypothetical protein